MATDPKLENYLATLERSLKLLPVSDRADIVTEIKSHVLSALERDPGASITDVLHALGEPETVANRYLAERGQAFVKPSISPIVKWLVVGFLGTVAIVLLFSGIVLFRFTPLLSVDNNQQHVRLLGGAIDINGITDKVRINGVVVGSDNGDGDENEGHRVAGRTLLSANTTSILVEATNGKIEVDTASGNELSWACKVAGKTGGSGGEPAAQIKDKQAVLDLSSFNAIKCTLLIPEKHELNLQLVNGKVHINKPRFSLDLKLRNGRLLITPDPGVAYHYELQVKNGRIDAPVSSSGPDALLIRALVENGDIGQNKSEEE